MGLLQLHGQIGSQITNNTAALTGCQDEDSLHHFPIEHTDIGCRRPLFGVSVRSKKKKKKKRGEM